MGVGLEIGTSDVLGNEASENRSGRLSLKMIEDIVSTIGDDGVICAELPTAWILTALVS